MPEVPGRIIEPCSESHNHVELTCRSEGHGFDMVAREKGCELVEFPMIDEDWNTAVDRDHRKAEEYARLLVVII